MLAKQKINDEKKFQLLHLEFQKYKSFVEAEIELSQGIASQALIHKD